MTAFAKFKDSMLFSYLRELTLASCLDFFSFLVSMASETSLALIFNTVRVM